MLPARLGPFLFAITVSCLMSLIISGVSTLRTYGLNDGFLGTWVAAWLPSWAVAFPSLFILAPIVRKWVARITA